MILYFRVASNFAFCLIFYINFCYNSSVYSGRYFILIDIFVLSEVKFDKFLAWDLVRFIEGNLIGMFDFSFILGEDYVWHDEGKIFIDFEYWWLILVIWFIYNKNKLLQCLFSNIYYRKHKKWDMSYIYQKLHLQLNFFKFHSQHLLILTKLLSS